MSQSRDPWALRCEDFPHNGTMREQLSFAVRYAILAPSTHNTQPWLFRIGADVVDVFVAPERTLPIIDPEGRQRFMSCGAALHNLRVALASFGLNATVHARPDPVARPNWIAEVRILGKRRPEPAQELLRDHIVLRRTNRQPFLKRPVSATIATQLEAAVTANGAWLERLHPRHKPALAAIISEADREQFADRHFRKELTQWLVPGGSDRLDGIPFPRKEYGSSMPLAVTMVRTFDVGDRVAAAEVAIATGSPALVVLGTPDDTIDDWIAAGEGMQAMLLLASTMGLSASFLNQPLEIPRMRERVRTMLARQGFPQLVMRIGTGPAVKRPTPRRDLDAVLLA